MGLLKCSLNTKFAYRLASETARCFSTTGMNKHVKLTSTSEEEMSHFNSLASTWWDVNGPQRILHKMNLLRVDFVHNNIKQYLNLNEDIHDPAQEIYIPPYNLNLLPESIRNAIVEEQTLKRDEKLADLKLSVLDVGCGGGILSESLSRLPFVSSVKGIDLSSEVIHAANLHKASDPFLKSKLNYQLSAIEDLPDNEKYDVVTLFEMLEHVNYPSEVLDQALQRVKPGGWIFLSTINRDFVSWFTTIFMGEHVLKIVPVGTHTLDKYIDESEIRAWFEEKKEFTIVDSKGCIYLPACGWIYSSTPNIGNYMMAIQRNK